MDSVVGAPIPIKLGAGASAFAAAWEDGTFPPFTTNAGVSCFSATSALSLTDFSVAEDLAAGGVLVDFVALALGLEVPTFVKGSLSPADESSEAPSVISGCETGAAVVVAAVAGGALAGFGVAGVESRADVATGWDDGVLPWK